MKKLLAAAVMSMFLFSCGGGDQEPADDNMQEETSLRDGEAAVEENEVEIKLTADDMMQYSMKEIKVPAGSKVELEFSHVGTMTVEMMGHNFVLLKQGVDLTTFAQGAMTMKDNGYLPEDMSDVIVNTKMLGGGESTEIEFDAPEPGTYQYLCTFPGHYGTMQGTFIVE